MAGTSTMRHVLVLPLGQIPFEYIQDVAKKIGITGLRLDNSPQIIVLSEKTTDLRLLQASSKEIVICISETMSYPWDSLFREFAWVLKPDGIILVHKTLEPHLVDFEREISNLKDKLTSEGFVEPQILPPTPNADFRMQPLTPLTAKSFGVVAKKSSFRIGCAFVLKKPAKGLVKVQLEDDTELIDEESLFTKEDLKKRKVPVGDCEVGSTREACKSCSCGRAKAEEKVELRPARDQIDTPQSSSGNDEIWMRSSMLAFTVISASEVLDMARELGSGGVEQSNPQVITQALSLTKLPLVCISMAHEFPRDLVLREVSRVLKPSGTIFLYKKTPQSVSVEMEKEIPALERKLMLAGFLEAQALQLKSETAKSFRVKAKKPSWKMGSALVLKKPAQGLVNVQLEDDTELIVEDSLLTEEDLKKPIVPVGDCEAGSTRKACKNCSCERAETEEREVGTDIGSSD